MAAPRAEAHRIAAQGRSAANFSPGVEPRARPGVMALEHRADVHAALRAETTEELSCMAELDDPHRISLIGRAYYEPTIDPSLDALLERALRLASAPMAMVSIVG